MENKNRNRNRNIQLKCLNVSKGVLAVKPRASPGCLRGMTRLEAGDSTPGGALRRLHARERARKRCEERCEEADSRSETCVGVKRGEEKRREEV